jgi:hypothetical protein
MTVSRDQIVRDLKKVRLHGLGERSELTRLSVLELTIVVAEADDSDEPYDRLLALHRILERVVDDDIATTPHPDDSPDRRAQAAEMLLYPPHRHAERSLSERRRWIEQYVARERRYERRTYEARLISDIADALFDRERAARARDATPITLDLSAAVRLDSAPESEAPAFVRELCVRPGDVVEVSVVVRLSDPVDLGHRADELAIRIGVGPPGETIVCECEARALNARHQPGYRPFDSATVRSEAGHRIRLDNPRAFCLQTSLSESVDRFAWEAGRRLPDHWLQILEWAEGRLEIKIRPTIDRTLTADVRDALKLSFLLDATQA